MFEHLHDGLPSFFLQDVVDIGEVGIVGGVRQHREEHATHLGAADELREPADQFHKVVAEVAGVGEFKDLKQISSPSIPAIGDKSKINYIFV